MKFSFHPLGWAMVELEAEQKHDDPTGGGGGVWSRSLICVSFGRNGIDVQFHME